MKSEYLKNILDIVTSFFTFMLVCLFLWKPRIIISDKIVRDINKSKFKHHGEVAWKFKIINKSILMKFYNFDICLIGIRYIRNSDGTKTEHRNRIELVAGVKVLTRYTPNFIVWLKRQINPEYTVNFIYRPLTYKNLDKLSSSYDIFELSIQCTDSLSGRIHYIIKKFKLTSIIEGEFSNDGKKNYVNARKIPNEAWINHEKRKHKK